jgi:hypothetical protein
MRLFKRAIVDMNQPAVCGDLWMGGVRTARLGTGVRHVLDQVS